MRSNKKLLKKYVRDVLREDFGGFDAGGLDFGGPYGMQFGSQSDLLKVFVKPFADVVHTAAAETKKLSQRTQTLLKVAFEAAMTSMLPFLGDDYEEIFAKHDDAIDKIKAQYKDVYDSTWTAFKDNDVVMSAFFYAPHAVITSATVRKSPVVAVNLMNVLSGGRLDNLAAKVKRVFKLGDEKKPLDRDEGPGMPEGVIREDRKKGAVDRLVAVMTQDKVIDAVKSSPETQRMMKAAQEVVNSSLQKVVARASALDKAQDLEQLQKLMGKRVPALEKLTQLPDEERKQASAQVIKGIRAAAKEFYAKSLEAQVKRVVKAGIPKDHPFVQAYARAIQQVRS